MNWKTWLAGMAGAVLAACAFSAPSPSPAPRVFVAIQPQAYFVQRVAGAHVQVEVLVGPGREPHTYEPTPRQVEDLCRARAFFSLGMPFEARLIEKARALNPALVTVDTAAGVPRRPDEDEHDAHAPAASTPGVARSGRSDSDADPHIWLAPRLIKIQAANICHSLQALDPPHSAEYAANLKQFEQELDGLDTRLAASLSPFKGRRFYVFHPSFGYFADHYGLVQVAVQSSGREPGARSLSDLIDHMKSDGARQLFVEPQFSQKTSEAIAAATGTTLVTIDPLAADPIRCIEQFAATLAASWGGRQTGP